MDRRRKEDPDGPDKHKGAKEDPHSFLRSPGPFGLPSHLLVFESDYARLTKHWVAGSRSNEN